MIEQFLKLNSPIFIASDHGGFELKKIIQNKFENLNFKDLGPINTDSVDYPDYASKLSKEILLKLSTNTEENPNAMGILICGSGQGMAMTANKYDGIRAALCWSKESALLSRSHNNANVLCLGARLLSDTVSLEIVKTFFSTAFDGGRHIKRINKINIK